MTEMSVAEVGRRLVFAGRFKTRAICVYGSETRPEGASPSTLLNTCVARAILKLAMTQETPPIYLGEDMIDDCCGGGAAMFGFREFDPGVKYFVSYGSPKVRNGAAEYLRATPELFEENCRALGKITPPGKYVVISACEDLQEGAPGAKSILLFGNAEQIRNLCALVHFRSRNPFNEIYAPQGPSCASFVTYAAGMAERAPRDAVFLGPDDPTGNSWFPEDFLSMAIPIMMARRMCEDIDQSFIVKRPKVAYPAKRIGV